MAKRTTEPRSAVEETSIQHERAPGYRVIFADGTLLRTQKRDILLTFYHDDAPVQTETAELTKDENGSRIIRTSGGFTTRFLRSHEVTIRMDLDDAAGLLLALLRRLGKEAPDLLKARGLEMQDVEGAQ